MYYKDITLIGPQAAIGYEDENLPTRVIIDISDLTKYGTGTTVLEVKRPCDREAYIAEQTEVDGNNFYWYPTKGDLEVSGLLKCQVKAVIGDQIVKTRVYFVRVIGALNGDGTLSGVVPDALQTFVESASGSEDAAKASAEEAKKAEEAAKASETAATKSASDADASAGESEQSKTQAQEYAQNAYNSAVGAESAKDDAEDARDEIRSMRAEAVTLSPGSDATASYSDGLLSLGIPRGDKGDKGDTGEQGPKGDKGDPGEVTQAEFDELSENKADIIVSSASGSIASFPDGAESTAKKLVVGIEPVQDLHGYDSPWPAGGGVNKFKISDAAGVTVASATYGLSIDLDAENETIRIHGVPTWSGNSSYTFRAITTKNGYWGHASVDHDYSGYKAYTEVLSKTSNVSSAGNFYVLDTSIISISQITVTDANAIDIIYRLSLNPDATPTSWTPYENICPITGWTGAKVTRTGKNLYSRENGEYNVPVYATNGSVASYADVNVVWVKVKPNTAYTITLIPNDTTAAYMRWIECDKNKGFIWRYPNMLTSADSTKTFTTKDNTEWVQLACNQWDTSNISKNVFEAMLVEGSTATPYEPYTGQTYPISWQSEAGTVYGGTLDVTKGELVVDRVLENKTWGKLTDATVLGTNERRKFSFSMASKYVMVDAITDFLCNTIGVYNISFSADTVHMYVANGNYAWLYLPNGTDSLTVIQLSYTIATPITYHLTPQEITTLLGQNNIWADTGDMSVTYRADTKLYIDKKFTELQALILEN